jgi:glycosyltransferase involved in cell wall biosynthesis
MVFHLLARQKPMIVSERGWLAECAGDACLTFPNQDFQALAKQMIFLYDHPDKQAYLSALCEQRLRVFEPQESIKQYKRLFQALINKSKPAQLNLGGAVNSKAQTDVAQTDKSTI